MPLSKATYLQLKTNTDESFVLTQFIGTEGLSQLFNYTLTAQSSNIAVKPTAILNKSVTVTSYCVLSISQGFSSR